MQGSPKGFETAFQLVGGCGRFQWMAMGLANLQLLLMTWNHMGYIFIGAVPQHWCSIYFFQQQDIIKSIPWTVEQIRNLSIPYINGKYDKCNHYNINYTNLIETTGFDFEFAYKLVHEEIQINDNNFNHEHLKVIPCDSWHYDNSIYKSTIVTQFDLVCQHRYLVPSIQAFYMIGAFFGTLVFGPINDRILGRRKSVLLAVVFVLIGGFSSAFSVSYLMFIITRFLVAIGTSGCMQAVSVWFLEHCDTKSRGKMYCISGTFFGVGYALLPVYAYFFREWSHLQLAFSVSTLTLLSFYWIFPESPRWLATHGHESKALRILQRIARINGYPTPKDEDLLTIIRSCSSSATQRTIQHQYQPAAAELKQNQATTTTASSSSTTTTIHTKLLSLITNFKTLVSTKDLRRVSFVIWILFVIVAFVYYGFAFSTVYLTSDPYLIVSLGALMEIPASLLPIPFLQSKGRRPTLIACYLITGLSSLLTPLVSSSPVVTTILSLIGKLTVASAFTVLYLVASEAYPTVVRSTGQGASTIFGRFGSIAAPFVADLLSNVYPNLPSFIFAGVGIFGGVVAFFLPEMKGVDMKDQVIQLQNPLPPHENDDDDDL